jgi:formate C-acetyltransferase
MSQATTDHGIPAAGSISFEDRARKPIPYDWGHGSTPRTAALRRAIKWKAAVVKDFIDLAIGLAKCTFRPEEGIRVDLDRARLVTESYRRTDGLPWAARVADAFVNVCDNLPVFIKSGELIVGDPNGAPDELRWYPEIAADFMPAAVTDGGFSQMVNDEERREIVEDICPYWRGRSIADRIKAVLPAEAAPDVLKGLLTPIEAKLWEMGIINLAYDYEVLFREGLEARIARAEASLAELDQQVLTLDPAAYVEKKTNWQAMASCGRAIIRFSQRHAQLARAQAAAERDEERRRELEEIAEILQWVPARPPRTFHEALQFFWIIEVTGHFIAVNGNGGGFRIDQIWWPYYEADLRSGRLTRAQALELVECLFLKIQEVGIALEWPVTFTGKAGGETFYTLNICGSKPDGLDASNDVSCVVLEAMCNLNINQPPIALLYHRNLSPAVVERAIDLLRAGTGHPSFFNHELIEKWALMRGYSPEDAKRTQVGGCVTNCVTGRYMVSSGAAGTGGMILPKVLEAALHEGGLEGDPERPDKPRTKDPRAMTSADELLDAFCEWVCFYTHQMKISWDVAQIIMMDTNPDPCNSLLKDEPLESGIDLKKWHKLYDTCPSVYPLGMITVVDSLVAIQHLVFDEERYTMDQLIHALRANWSGHDVMQKEFLNAPKYGNDDDYADAWAIKVATRLEQTIGQVKDAWGHTFISDGGTAAGYQTVGLSCGATPDGRLAMTHLSDGSRSPMAGADIRGPTATLNSAAKIPFLHPELFNQRFMPEFLEGENRRLFAAYLREWYEKGTVPHIQFNVVSSDVLRDAQAHPENYPDLQVRVAGYSAFWVDLPRETQDSIMARTEHGFGSS